MRITVKILFGEERHFEVSDTMSVLELKEMVNEKCKIPVSHQKLLFNGRALIDGNVLSEYGIQEGTRITLFVSHPFGRVSAIGKSLPAAPRLHNLRPVPPLHNVMHDKLRLFYSDEDSQKLADEFMIGFNTHIATLSLDDIERLATQYLEEDRLAVLEEERRRRNAEAAYGAPVTDEADDNEDIDTDEATDDDDNASSTIDHNAAPNKNVN